MEKLQHRIATVLGILMLFFLTFTTSLRTRNYQFIHEATSAPLRSHYDYIVVGGGTAGCPLAATLSQKATVLLLERGGSPYADPNITNIYAFGRSLHDDSPWSPSQAFVSEDGVANNRARVLGGGTCINGGFYSRADTKFLMESGLVDDEKLLNESYRWVEKKIVFKPDLKRWQCAMREGLLEAGVLPDNGYTYDHLYGTKVGGVTYDECGNRYMAADLLDYANPYRITIRLHATVIRILFTKGKSGKMAASGVVFRDSYGIKRIAYLKDSESNKNEIILSAGTIGSPHLLMLSGVGPANHLTSHNITVVLDQPLVGQGLSDNTFNVIFVPSLLPLQVSLPQAVGITRFGSYIEAISNISLQLPTTDKTVEDIDGGYIGPKIMGPLSTGYMELKNRNVDENPTVRFNYFSDPKDLERCVNGLKITGKIIESESFSKFGNHSLSHLLNLTSSLKLNFRPKHENTSTSLEQFCKDNVITIWHYHGGCQIGKVVDKDYKILGLDSIRVIDSSIFLSSPGTNPQATVMMLGRYMGVKILRERSNNVHKTEGERQNVDFSHHLAQ